MFRNTIKIGVYENAKPDKQLFATEPALVLAKQYRDELLIKLPPISRKEFCLIRRSNNHSGITDVCKYAKPYTLSDGTVRVTWYWEANWPNDRGEVVKACFSVKEHGESVAR